MARILSAEIDVIEDEEASVNDRLRSRPIATFPIPSRLIRSSSASFPRRTNRRAAGPPSFFFLSLFTRARESNERDFRRSRVCLSGNQTPDVAAESLSGDPFIALRLSNVTEPREEPRREILPRGSR